MKNALIAISALLALSACGAGAEEATGHEAPAPAVPGYAAPAPARTPDPAAAPAPGPDTARFVYANALLGINFSIDAPGFAAETFPFPPWSTLPMDVFHFPGGKLFIGTVHPSSWHEFRMAFAEEAAEQFWQQPDEPSRVFVTEHGVTVVVYENALQRVSFLDGQPIGLEGQAALFVFRADGRDYRKIDGAQILYSVFVAGSPYVRNIENQMATVHRTLNSLRFHDGPAPVSLPISETGQGLGITQANFPRLGGSTSTLPLLQQVVDTLIVRGSLAYDDPYTVRNSFRTMPSYELLIAGELDLILVPEPSAHALRLADGAGVELEFVPVASEALVFVTTAGNPVGGISTEQVIEIYADMAVTNWQQLGGGRGRIMPFNRNPHSGSQTLMENMVLQGREIHPELERYQIGEMSGMLEAVAFSARDEAGDFAIGYTVFHFLGGGLLEEYSLKMLALDGVFPSRETILSGEYPLSTSYFAVTRADAPEDCPARRIARWLAAPDGQAAVEAAGFGAAR